MIGQLSTPGKVTGLETWSDYEAAGGALVQAWDLPGTLVSLEEHENLSEHVHEIELVCARTDAAFLATTHNAVLRVTLEGGVKEFRVDEREVRRERTGGMLAHIAAVGPHMDLSERSGIIRQPYANGRLDAAVQLYGLTPTQGLDFILRNSEVPAFFAIGTVDFTERVDLQFEFMTPWAAILELADRVAEREGVPTYVRVLRDGVASYAINIVADPAPAVPAVPITYAQNELSLREREVAERWATEVIIRSGGEPGEFITLAENAFQVESVAGSTVTFLAADSPVGEDGQLDGLFLEKPDGTLTEVTGSTAPRQITVADTSGIVVGRLVTFRADASGTDLISLTSPSANGRRTLNLTRPDIPPIVNLIPNPFLIDWAGGMPIGWTTEGTPVVSQDGSDFFSRFGLSSAHLHLDKDDGIISDELNVRFTPDRAHLVFSVSLWLVSGAVRVELHDYSHPDSPEHPKIWYPDVANVRARTTETDRWIELSVFPGEDFWRWGSDTFRARIVAEVDGTECYVDAVQIINRAMPADNFYNGSAANDLWLIARDYLNAFSVPPRYYDVEFVDEERLGFTVGGEVVLGADAELTDAELIGAPVTKLIEDVRRNLRIEGQTEIQLERIPAALADRFLGRPKTPIRKDVPENTQKPPCPGWIEARRVGDLEVTWERVQAARYELRVPEGVLGSGSAGGGGAGSGGAAISGPGEPALATSVSDRPFNTTTEDGWSDSGPNFTIVSDATAPQSPPNVGQMRFPVGHPGGRGPATTGRGFTAKAGLYTRFRLKMSSNWIGHPSAVNKVIFVGSAAGEPLDPVYFSAQGAGSGNLHFQVRTQPGGGFNRNLGANLGTARINRGQWHDIEVTLVANTPGQHNGEVHVKFDGTTTHRYTDVLIFKSGDTPAQFNHLKWNPTWGGTGGSLIQEQTQRMDHLKVSTFDPAQGFSLPAALGPLATSHEGEWSEPAAGETSALSSPGDQPDRERWENGTRLTVVDTAFWILKEGETVSGFRPADITEIMLETYNKWGVPGDCIRVLIVDQEELPNQCPNLMPIDAGATYCSS